jgi:hypothetical protein
VATEANFASGGNISDAPSQGGARKWYSGNLTLYFLLGWLLMQFATNLITLIMTSITVTGTFNGSANSASLLSLSSSTADVLSGNATNMLIVGILALTTMLLSLLNRNSTKSKLWRCLMLAGLVIPVVYSLLVAPLALQSFNNQSNAWAKKNLDIQNISKYINTLPDGKATATYSLQNDAGKTSTFSIKVTPQTNENYNKIVITKKSS